MNIDFDTGRADAWRDALIHHVSVNRPRHRILVPAALVTAGIVGGAGATAAFASTDLLGSWLYPAQPTGQPSPGHSDAVDAPAGILPGAPIIALVGSVDTVEVSTATNLPLTDRPLTATHLRVTITGRTPGSISFGTDPSGNNPSSSWTADDIASGTAGTSYDFPLDSDHNTLYLQPAAGADALITTQYVVHVPTRLGVNANGDTYGVDGTSGAPDLVAVTGQTPSGDPIDGYVRRDQLNAFSPDATAPTTPNEAIQMQTDRERDYPNGWDIPLYQTDGTTQIGIFHTG